MFTHVAVFHTGLVARKPVFGGCENSGADQPVHPGSLISTFIVPFLESIICKLATSEISVFKLVSVAEETALSLALSETPKTGFSCAG